MLDPSNLMLSMSESLIVRNGWPLKHLPSTKKDKHWQGKAVRG